MHAAKEIVYTEIGHQDGKESHDEIEMEPSGGLQEGDATAVESYAATMPAFIDEFLSPEGIITKKRTIDAAIAENDAKVAAIRARISELNSANADLVDKIDEYKVGVIGQQIGRAHV